MPEERDRALLLDLSGAPGDIQAFVDGMTEAEFLADRKTQLAVAMALVVVGESANRLSQTAQSEAANIDRRAGVSLRSRIAHGYSAVDQRLVWSIVQLHVADLGRAVLRLQSGLKAGPDP
jgi:uncharacterized protein with HEPN domain